MSALEKVVPLTQRPDRLEELQAIAQKVAEERSAAVRRVATLAEWREHGEKLFGHDRMDWRFVCPACGHVASGHDHKRAGFLTTVGIQCILCDHVGLGPVKVDMVIGDVQVFEFARPE